MKRILLIISLVFICISCQNDSISNSLDESGISKIVLNQDRLSNLVILGKVWGFLKYYHPKVCKGNFNWDNELFKILPHFILIKRKEDRNSTLQSWIEQIGEIANGKLITFDSSMVKLYPNLSWISDTLEFGKVLSQKLILIRNAERKDSSFYVSLFKDVGNPNFKNEFSYSKYSFPDVGIRLLSLFRYWNIIEYFYPYKNLIEGSWSNVLSEHIPKFINASNSLEYRLAILSLMTCVHDTHSNIFGDSIISNYHGRNSPPFKINFIENLPVIVGYDDKQAFENTGMKKGDIILKVNNRKIEDIIKERLPITPASNYSTQLRDLAFDLLSTNDTILKIEYQRENKIKYSTIPCFSWKYSNLSDAVQRSDTCFKFISPDIAYIYPGTIKNVYLTKIMARALKAKGIIIDFRCYPSDYLVYTLGNYLMPDSTPFARISLCNVKSPGLFSFSETLKVGRENLQYYKGKIVIIVNELTQSSAEFHCMAFRVAPKAIVLGSTTAGADGNISSFQLPGGIVTMISAVGIYYPDGKETQKVGIIPDIEVKPTIKGVREGRDELLEKAIEIIIKK